MPNDRPISKWFQMQTSTGEDITIQLRILYSTSPVSKNKNSKKQKNKQK